MKSLCIFESAWKRTFVASLLVLPILSACGRTKNTDVPVSIHAVNYSNQEFEYYLQDPENKSNIGGGESINRYAAGGTMCCYTLPKMWRAGMKVKIDYDLYFPKQKDGNIRKSTESKLIDIPQYVEPQELWVVRDIGGAMSIVLSNFQPDHPSWPGKVKGWPIPSLDYQRERWSLDMEHELGGVKLFQEILNDINENPEAEAKRAWPDEIKYHPELRGQFTGPEDPKFLFYLKKDYERALERSRTLVRQLEESKP